MQVEALNGTHIDQVAVGFFHTSALASDGRVFSWGWGGGFVEGAGGLGLGHKTQTPLPTVLESLVEDRIAMTSISSGARHMLGLDSDGMVWSWGSGEYGRLGHGGSSDALEPEPVELLSELGSGKCVQICCGDAFSMALMEDGSLYVRAEPCRTVRAFFSRNLLLCFFLVKRISPLLQNRAG